MPTKITYLKTDKNSDWLSYQRGIPKPLRAKAKAMNIPLMIVKPLGLTKSEPASLISKAIEKHNEKFEDLLRLIRATGEGTLDKKQAAEGAKALLETRGVKQGALDGLDPMDPTFDATIDAALGIHQNQDHYQWQQNHPNEDKLPESLVTAVQTLLNTSEGHEQFHLFSDAIEHYKQHRQQKMQLAASSEGQLKKLQRELDKDLERINGFYIYSGNQEFTTDNCNVALRLYRKHLLEIHKTSPATAKRDLAPAASAIRKYAEEVAINVAVTTKLTIDEQKAHTKQRPVVDVETELPLIWAAAHDDSYKHLFRLHAFGIFSGSHASELIQSDVDEVFEQDGYFILRGTKRTSRTRPVVIINETHKELLMQFKDYPKDSYGFASICGKRAEQTEATHSKLIKDQMLKATGNSKLIPYSMRHTGKHLGELKGISEFPTFKRMFGWASTSATQDDYGAAGIYSNAMMTQFRDLTEQLTAGLQDFHSPTPASKSNVVKLKR